MIILGIDPGLAIIGWGVIKYEGARFKTLGYGSIQTPAGIPTEERLALIYQGMCTLIEQYRPDEHRLFCGFLTVSSPVTTMALFIQVICGTGLELLKILGARWNKRIMKSAVR